MQEGKLYHRQHILDKNKAINTDLRVHQNLIF